MSQTAVTLEPEFAVNSARCPREMFPRPITPIPRTSFAPRILPYEAAATASAARDPTSRRVYVPMGGILNDPTVLGLNTGLCKVLGIGKGCGSRTVCSWKEPREWLGNRTASP